MTCIKTLHFSEPDTSQINSAKEYYNCTLSNCDCQNLILFQCHKGTLAEELLAHDNITIQIMMNSLLYAVCFCAMITISCVFGSVVNLRKVQEEQTSSSHMTGAIARLAPLNGKYYHIQISTYSH